MNRNTTAETLNSSSVSTQACLCICVCVYVETREENVGCGNYEGYEALKYNQLDNHLIS